MPRPRKSYPPESPSSADRVGPGWTKEFEPSSQAIRRWVKQAARDAGERADGLTTPEREELTKLRRELRPQCGDPDSA